MSSRNQFVQQAIVVPQSEAKFGQAIVRLALFNPDGTPFNFDGGDSPVEVTWENVSDKPTVIAAGDTAAEARSAIGAGTSNLALGTTGTTAKAGNYTPSWSEVSGKPAVIAAGADAAAARTAIGAGTGNSNLAVGSSVGSALASSGSAGTSAQAARADHVHPFPTAAQVGAAPTSHTHTIANVTGLQTIIDDLTTRVAALESAAG